MAQVRPSFVRKLSDEEIRGQYIVIQKSSLDFFPKPGKLFKLKVAGKYHETSVNAVEIWNRGPRKPSFNYRIDMRSHVGDFPLRWGHKVIIERVKEGYYEIKQ